MNKLELLSPAGSYEGFLAAIAAGADAVYAGGSAFGARAFAKNFTDEEILSAIDVAHLYGKKFYLTVNTLCKEREFHSLRTFLIPFYEQGLDGVIVQDIGVVSFLLEAFPGMEVHGSTQMSISNVGGARYLKDMGLTRVVLSRELSLDEISNIHCNCDIEIESFIHGAMCYAYSGQCLMSSFLGGRSGNRGRCAQPCRLSYEAYEKGIKLNSVDESYCLSMKDLCSLEILPEIIESGVISFKIEGRMKGPQYTGFVTSVYRKYLDQYLSKGKKGYKVIPEDLIALTETYKRSESETGYYKQHNGRKLITLNKPSYESSKDVYYKIAPDSIPLSINGSFVTGETAKLWANDENDNYAFVEGAVVEKAIKRPITESDIIKNISKTGDSSFIFKDYNFEVSENAFLPVSSINELRRNFISEYTETVLAGFRRTYNNLQNIQVKNSLEDNSQSALQNNHTNPYIKYSASCETIDQLSAIADNIHLFYRIYIDTAIFKYSYSQATELIKQIKDSTEIFLALPYIFRNKNINTVIEIIDSCISLIDGFLIRNFDELNLVKTYGLKCITDASLYCFNKAAIYHLLTNGICEFTYPYELNIHELKELECFDKGELISYGYVPLMISAGCVKKTLDKCDGTKGIVTLKDRYDKDFDVIRDCLYCYNRLLNSVPLDLSKDIGIIRGSGFKALRLCFTKEDKALVTDIISSYANNIALEIEHTRGHFKKSVD